MGRIYAKGDNRSYSEYVKPKDLPIYGSSRDSTQYEYVEKISPLRQNISAVRSRIWSWWDKCEDTINYVKGKYDIGYSHTRDTIHYIQNDPSMVPRATTISLAGLGAVVYATVRRGGLVKKIVYPSIAMGGMAALCYPRETAKYSNVVYSVTKKEASYAAEKYLGRKGKKSEQDRSKQSSASEQMTEEIADKAYVDIGQSSPEDKDLYTTRT